MDPKDKSILSEDGRRFTIEEDEITGTESTGESLAYEPDNITANEAKDDRDTSKDDSKEQS